MNSRGRQGPRATDALSVCQWHSLPASSLGDSPRIALADSLLDLAVMQTPPLVLALATVNLAFALVACGGGVQGDGVSGSHDGGPVRDTGPVPSHDGGHATAASGSSRGGSGSSGPGGSSSSSSSASSLLASSSGGGSSATSSSSGSGGVVACVANVLDGVPCPAGQTCNQTGTACIGNFAGACSSDADCPCGCSCAGAPGSSCTNCLTALGPYFDFPPNLGISGAGCSSDSACGPACLGFSCVGDGDGGTGYCEASGLILSPPTEETVCAASRCTDAGVACASIPCTADGDCTAACGSGWTCFYGEDLQGPVLPGHCGEPYPDAGSPTGDGGFLGAFSGDQITEYETYADGGWQSGYGGGYGPDAYTQLLVAGPDAGTFIASGFMFSDGCNPVFQIVRPGFATAPVGTVCPLAEQWFAPYVLDFGYAALSGDQLTIETLWVPASDAGTQEADWSYYTLSR